MDKENKEEFIYYNDEWTIKNDNPLDKQTYKERIEVLKKRIN